MDNNSRKYLGILLIILELLLASCLMVIFLIYSTWPVSDSKQEISGKFWFLEAGKRLFFISFAAGLIGLLLHKINTYWIRKTGFASIKKSKYFSRVFSILILLTGITGLIIFMLQNR